MENQADKTSNLNDVTFQIIKGINPEGKEITFDLEKVLSNSRNFYEKNAVDWILWPEHISVSEQQENEIVSLIQKHGMDKMFFIPKDLTSTPERYQKLLNWLANDVGVVLGPNNEDLTDFIEKMHDKNNNMRIIVFKETIKLTQDSLSVQTLEFEDSKENKLLKERNDIKLLFKSEDYLITYIQLYSEPIQKLKDLLINLDLYNSKLLKQVLENGLSGSEKKEYSDSGNEFDVLMKGLTPNTKFEVFDIVQKELIKRRDSKNQKSYDNFMDLLRELNNVKDFIVKIKKALSEEQKNYFESGKYEKITEMKKEIQDLINIVDTICKTTDTGFLEKRKIKKAKPEKMIYYLEKKVDEFKGYTLSEEDAFFVDVQISLITPEETRLKEIKKEMSSLTMDDEKEKVGSSISYNQLSQTILKEENLQGMSLPDYLRLRREIKSMQPDDFHMLDKDISIILPNTYIEDVGKMAVITFYSDYTYQIKEGDNKTGPVLKIDTRSSEETRERTGTRLTGVFEI